MGVLIHYSAGYKYQLSEDYTIELFYVQPPTGGAWTEWLGLYQDEFRVGLWIRKGYAWDGPSGPAIDTKNFMRGSLVHDALFQLMRLGKIPPDARHGADNELYRIIREDGMSKIRAWWVLQAVHYFAKRSSEPEAVRPILTAP